MIHNTRPLIRTVADWGTHPFAEQSVVPSDDFELLPYTSASAIGLSQTCAATKIDPPDESAENIAEAIIHLREKLSREVQWYPLSMLKFILGHIKENPGDNTDAFFCLEKLVTFAARAASPLPTDDHEKKRSAFFKTLFTQLGNDFDILIDGARSSEEIALCVEIMLCHMASNQPTSAHEVSKLKLRQEIDRSARNVIDLLIDQIHLGSDEQLRTAAACLSTFLVCMEGHYSPVSLIETELDGDIKSLCQATLRLANTLGYDHAHSLFSLLKVVTTMDDNKLFYDLVIAVNEMSSPELSSDPKLHDAIVLHSQQYQNKLFEMFQNDTTPWESKHPALRMLEKSLLHSDNWQAPISIYKELEIQQFGLALVSRVSKQNTGNGSLDFLRTILCEPGYEHFATHLRAIVLRFQRIFEDLVTNGSPEQRAAAAAIIQITL